MQHTACLPLVREFLALLLGLREPERPHSRTEVDGVHETPNSIVYRRLAHAIQPTRSKYELPAKNEMPIATMRSGSRAPALVFSAAKGQSLESTGGLVRRGTKVHRPPTSLRITWNELFIFPEKSMYHNAVYAMQFTADVVQHSNNSFAARLYILKKMEEVDNSHQARLGPANNLRVPLQSDTRARPSYSRFGFVADKRTTRISVWQPQHNKKKIAPRGANSTALMSRNN